MQVITCPLAQGDKLHLPMLFLFFHDSEKITGNFFFPSYYVCQTRLSMSVWNKTTLTGDKTGGESNVAAKMLDRKIKRALGWVEKRITEDQFIPLERNIKE